MSKQSVCIAYTGQAVDSGIMDVNELAPALLAFGDLVSECNSAVNGDRATINVYVKSNFQKGSFEINFEAVQTLATQLKSLFGSGIDCSLDEILGAIGFMANVSGLAGINLMELLRWQRGRKVDSIKRIDKGTVRFIIENDYKDIDILGFELYRRRGVRKKIEGVLEPLRVDGIDSFEVRGKDKTAPIQHISKDEVEYFSAPDDDIEPKVFESTRRCIIKIASVNFDKKLKWRFTTDTVKFYATIEDEEFSRNVENGQIAFANGVSLEVDLREVQRLSQAGTTQTDYVVVKVHDVIGRSEQLALPFEELD